MNTEINVRFEGLDAPEMENRSSPSGLNSAHQSGQRSATQELRDAIAPYSRYAYQFTRFGRGGSVAASHGNENPELIATSLLYLTVILILDLASDRDSVAAPSPSCKRKRSNTESYELLYNGTKTSYSLKIKMADGRG